MEVGENGEVVVKKGKRVNRQNQLNNVPQTIILYEVKTIYFNKYRKFRKYFLDLQKLKMKFDFRELCDSNFYYCGSERALHFTQLMNNKHYNRIYMDSIIKVVYIEVRHPQDRTAGEGWKEKSQFLVIKYLGLELTKSAVLVEVENEELITVFKNILYQAKLKIELYNHSKLNDSQ